MRWDINIYLHAECTAYYQQFHAHCNAQYWLIYWDGHIALDVSLSKIQIVFFCIYLFNSRHTSIKIIFHTSYGFENTQAILGITW